MFMLSGLAALVQEQKQATGELQEEVLEVARFLF
jgi:hypothetical protein